MKARFWFLAAAMTVVLATPFADASAQVVDRTGQRVSRCDLFRDLGRALPPECGGTGPAASEGERTRGRIVIGRPSAPPAPAAQPSAATARPAAPAPAPAAAPAAVTAAPAAPAPASPAIAAPVPSRAAPRSVALTINFELGSAELRPDARRVLDDLAAVIQANSGDRFVIEGHTDARGSDETNQDLSERRAQSAIDYLVNRHGIDRNRLEAKGYGRTRLLLPQDPNNGRNRRVQVSNIGS